MKKTYGQTLIDHKALRHELDDDVIEYRRLMEREIMQRIYNLSQSTKDQDGYRSKDFYIVMLIRVEKIGQSPATVLLARKSCPSPVYKQSVFKYRHASGALEFLWTIPDKILYYHILNHKQKYLHDKETADLAKFVILMESGELEKWIIKENGEKIDAIIKIKKEEPAYG